MKIHEFQAKHLLSNSGVAVPSGACFDNFEQAFEYCKGLQFPLAIKAQIHAGGRGKGGGVKIAKSLEDCALHIKSILGMNLVTPQTEASGQKVRKILIEQGIQIEKEYYFSIVTDRETQLICLIFSSEGGMDIEEVAHTNPDKIIKRFISPLENIDKLDLAQVAQLIGIPANLSDQFALLVKNAYQLYLDVDATLIEINPLVVTKDSKIYAADAKFNFDGNALFRHPEIVALRDLYEEKPLEIEASKYDLSYIELDGNIACLVNGAGLAMATMDTIKLFGANPANFLDVGGGANEEKVKEAFKIMTSNSNVKAILINIFGGIMRCDVIASGIVNACREVQVKVPIIVRMKGTNEALGKKILADSKLEINAADTLDGAAKLAVACVGV